ncbi:MAG: hypothetical protein Q3X11_00755, partial [Fusicatenibacter sp.]|nr:hypothetical protein [Fusicatenibacter sp.]
MLNYEEELKKFKPCLDVDEVEDAIYSRDLTVVIDILKEMMKNDKPEQKNETEEEKEEKGAGMNCKNLNAVVDVAMKI